MSVHHIVYLSTPTTRPTVAMLDALLRQCRSANAANGIRGLLLCGSQLFAQIIEGETPAVLALYQRLRQDERHYGLFKMADKLVAAPAFTDWHMAYRRDAPDPPPPGYLPLSPATWPAFRLPAADALLLETLRRLVAPD